MNLLRRTTQTGLICAFLASCATIPATSIYKLRNFDIATTDVSRLRVAVQVPRSIRIKPAGAKLAISVRLEDGALIETEAFVLDELDASGARGERPPQPAKWTHVAAYRLKPADIDRLSDFRSRITDLKQRHGDRVKGSISIAVDGCARALIADGPVLITTWIRSEETVDYVVLNRDLDLRRETENAGRQLGIEPCED